MKTMKILWMCLIVVCTGLTAHAQDPFTARFGGQKTIDGKNCVAVTFSGSLDSKQNLNSYVSLFTQNDVAVEGAWILSKDPKVIYFNNIEAGASYKILVHKGLKSAAGNTLKEAKEYHVTTRQVVPTINFDSNGFILPSRLNRGLPVNTLNIDKADIDFFRVKQEAYSTFSREFGRQDKLDYYQSKGLKKYADLVYSGRWDLEIKKDLRTSVNIPITHIKALETPGIYFAVLRGAGIYDYSYSCSWFTISDLGLHIKTYSNLMQVHVQSLETARPVKGVSIEGFDKNGRSTVKVVTGDQGIARITGKVETVKYIAARFENNITFVSMDMPAIDLSEFKTATEPFRPVDFFCYGPRDLYRPGESVVIDALLRDSDGQMAANLPVHASVIRPDGRMIYEFTLKGDGFNYYHHTYTLPNDAMTGKWRITFRQAAASFKEYPFTVAEFLPERIKLMLEDKTDRPGILSVSDTPVIKLKGDFLYGAPASGSRASAKAHIRPARELFKEQWPGYEFGDITDQHKLYVETEEIRLDKDGRGQLSLENEWKEARSPLDLTANISLYDSGGRPVVRNQSWQIWPGRSLVGIRALFEDDQVNGDGTARFEIMMVDQKGKRIKADNLKAVVVKEHREYYWEYRHDRWQWHFTSQSYPVDAFEIDLPVQGPATVSIPVEWGGYRLEIRDPKTNLVSSRRFWAGWHPDSASAAGGANRPDRVSLVLDKPVYQANDQVNVTIKAPDGGTGYLFVESDTNLLTIPVTVPVQGKTIAFTIDPSWMRHDLHVSGLIVRNQTGQTDVQAGQLPKRSVGLIHLPLDRSGRKLNLDIDAPENIEPNQSIQVTVKARTSDAGIAQKAWVTLAAVDVGILNLSGFQTPDPHGYFFQARKYSVNSHDVYQRLIEAVKGSWASQRFGGDAPTLSRGGDRPSTDVRIVCISKQAVQVNEKGEAVFTLDIPDFNGRVRLMAIGHTAAEFGSSEREMTIAAPLVTQITMPRFLSMGDRASLVIDAHNMTDEDQTLDLKIQTAGPVSPASKTSEQVQLSKGEKTAVIFPVFARQQLGSTKIQLSVSGLILNGVERQIQRTWTLDTRPAWPDRTKIFRKRLEPGSSLNLGSKQMENLIEQTIDVQAMISTSPPINILAHVRHLDAYPYGCLEQTCSGIFPHVILSRADFHQLGLTDASDSDTEKKIHIGIQRLMEKQKTSGGFGLWSATAKESDWLTCYVADFLLHARQAGMDVPESALSKALKRLSDYVRRPGTIHAQSFCDKKAYVSAVRVYAAFVLARVQEIRMGDARALYQSVKDDLKGPLAFVHAGLALTLSGDLKLGPEVLKRSLTISRSSQSYIGDYGSNVRDFAHSYYLLSEFYPGFGSIEQFMFLLADELQTREYLSTQERNALVLAGSVGLKNKQQPWQASVRKGDKTQVIDQTGLTQVTSMDGESANGFSITNTGRQDLYVSAALAGYPDQQPEPVSSKVQIQRRTLTLDGKPWPKERETQLKSGDRMLVELSFKAEQRMPGGLIVDLLPAGLELEDPNLSGSTIIDAIIVDEKTVAQWHQLIDVLHTEYRDDRFVGAVNIAAGEWFRIFYPVRVVSPGSFLIPPPMVEDMYRPAIRAIGKTSPLMTIENP